MSSLDSFRACGRTCAALLAGLAAIIVNMLALKAADLVPLATARGGLLRLIRPWAQEPLHALGIERAWKGLSAPWPDTALFQQGFHLVVGLLMALVYAWMLEPLLPGKPWFKGICYAAGVWIVNAALVLPATGEGFAGSANLSVGGMLWFAAAHTAFFVLLAILYAALRGRA